MTMKTYALLLKARALIEMDKKLKEMIEHEAM